MSLKISANTFFLRRYLEIDSSGITFCETAALGGTRTFRFDQVDCVLMSNDNVLSFQVGQEVFSLPTKPRKRRHQEAIETFVREVKRAAGARLA